MDSFHQCPEATQTLQIALNHHFGGTDWHARQLFRDRRNYVCHIIREPSAWKSTLVRAGAACPRNTWGDTFNGDQMPVISLSRNKPIGAPLLSASETLQTGEVGGSAEDKMLIRRHFEPPNTPRVSEQSAAFRNAQYRFVQWRHRRFGLTLAIRYAECNRWQMSLWCVLTGRSRSTVSIQFTNCFFNIFFLTSKSICTPLYFVLCTSFIPMHVYIWTKCMEV